MCSPFLGLKCSEMLFYHSGRLVHKHTHTQVVWQWCVSTPQIPADGIRWTYRPSTTDTDILWTWQGLELFIPVFFYKNNFDLLNFLDSCRTMKAPLLSVLSCKCFCCWLILNDKASDYLVSTVIHLEMLKLNGQIFPLQLEREQTEV